METISVGGRRYSDPDVLSLIKATGSLVDPRSSVLNQARKRLQTLNKFHAVPSDPIERLTILASICGIGSVVPMNIEQQHGEKRDAILVPDMSGGRSIIYNPSRPPGRIAFSIAHEISHTFFPNSIKGARFRNICASDSKEANELESLCNLGASELLMPIEQFQSAAEMMGYSLSSVSALTDLFGSSFEATVFRLASAHPGIAVAGLVRYRLRVGEERQKRAIHQPHLFASAAIAGEELEPKYRRQSIYLSDACNDNYMIRWNKSFELESIVYKAGKMSVIQTSVEGLPNGLERIGRIESVRAPYQREDADPEFGDVLFFWSTND